MKNVLNVVILLGRIQCSWQYVGSVGGWDPSYRMSENVGPTWILSSLSVGRTVVWVLCM